MARKQRDLFGGVYPDAPGARDTDTSRAAAEAIKPRLSAMQSNVLRVLRIRPMTSIEVAHALRLSYAACQPRLSELRAKGLVEDSGQRGISRDPRLTAIVWTIIPQQELQPRSQPSRD